MYVLSLGALLLWLLAITDVLLLVLLLWTCYHWMLLLGVLLLASITDVLSLCVLLWTCHRMSYHHVYYCGCIIIGCFITDVTGSVVTEVIILSTSW